MLSAVAANETFSDLVRNSITGTGMKINGWLETVVAKPAETESLVVAARSVTARERQQNGSD